MDKTHAVCKQCIAQHYWNHADGQKCFFKVMVGDFRNVVGIPKKFATNVRGHIAEEIKLEVPNGKTYYVKIAKKQNDLFFGSGWSTFASAYDLEPGDFLTFAFDGHSHFKVQIFDASCCEKEFSSVLTDCTPCIQQRRDNTHAACKQCIAHHYWNHVDGLKCFFKVMMGDFSNGKDIPIKFATNVRGHIAEEVKLEVPNGKTYCVKITKKQNDLIFGSGWSTFASAYDLEPGDFLTFAFDGHSYFKVQIFDASCCEKELSCVLTDCTPCVQQSFSQGIHIQSVTTERLAKQCIGSSSQSKKTAKMSPTNCPENSNEDFPSSERIQEPMNSGGFQKPTKCCFVLPTGYNMTNEQNNQVDALVHKIRPQIPLYVTAMDKTSVATGFLAMDKDYALKYISDVNGTIILSLPDGSETWAINLDINIDGRYTLSIGWLNFIHDNRLQEGDICIFQPSKGNNNMVLIFHPLEESCRIQRPGYAPSTQSPKHRVTEPPPYMVPRFTILNEQQKRKVIKKVQKIDSEIPIYVAVIHNSNLNLSILNFGSDYARMYLPCKDGTMRLRRPSKDYTWKAELRVINRRRALGRGWKQFLDENKLKLGDICLFQLMKNRKKLTMSVHIIRKERCG